MTDTLSAPAQEAQVVLQLASVSMVIESVSGRGRARDVQRTTVLDQISLAVGRGSSLGLVAERGAGADALLRVAAGVLSPTAGTVAHPSVAGDGGIQVVLADAVASVDVRTRVDEHVGWISASLPGQLAIERRARTLDALFTVGLAPDVLDQPVRSLPPPDRRRVLLARAAAAHPALLILEHVTRGLGPIDRGQVLGAVEAVAAAFDCAVLVHDEDLAFTASVSDRLAVLHAGRIVEIGPTVQVVGAPAHPYARALFDALPVPRPAEPEAQRDHPRPVLPSLRPVTGCRFHPRCTFADERCGAETPELMPTEMHGSSHLAACFHPQS